MKTSRIKKHVYVIKMKHFLLKYLRQIPFIHNILGIPIKRVDSLDTDEYFEARQDPKLFLNKFDKEVLHIRKHYVLNNKAFGNSQKNLFICDNFIMSLPDAKYYHDHKSVVTKEGFQLAMVSNHPEVTQNEHALFHKLYLPKLKVFSGLGVVLSTPNDQNYYHCLFQIAPKIWSIERNGYLINQVDWFFLELTGKIYQDEIISSLALDRANIVNLKKYNYVKAEQMLILPTYSRPEPWICSKLRDAFLTRNKSGVFNKRIYISRNSANIRNLINEEELLVVLKKFGFHVLDTEGLTIREQAQIFNNAEVIMSPHGAALSNIVFCEPD